MSLTDIPTAVAAIKAGRPVIVADDEGRENEGDVIISAELASQQWMAWLVRNSSGFVCAPMTNAIADALDLPPMVSHNEDPRGTAYTVSVDAADRLSTGISAADRAHTLRVLADPASTPAALNRPGHILPLRAVDGGVRARDGHTEAAVELMQLAGLRPVAAISEIVADDGEMMRLPGLIEFGAREHVPVITIADLVTYLNERDAASAPSTPDAAGPDAGRPAPAESDASAATTHPAGIGTPDTDRVRFEVETTIPSTHGPLTVRAYRDRTTGADHVAIVNGPLTDGALVRVHSECLTGEAFGSLKCECGPQLRTAIDRVQAEGGAVVYLRGHEGRGIGLVNKLRAYALQEQGLDTLDANLALGLPADARDYGAAVAIIADLGLSRIRLLSNNPDKRSQLEAHGIAVDALEPLVVGVDPVNAHYLETKRDRMGHALPDDLAALAPHDAAEQAAQLEGHPS